MLMLPEFNPACVLAPSLCLIADAAKGAATGAADSVLEILASNIMQGVDWGILALISWLLVPSIDLNNGAAGQLQSWLLPITAMVVVAGLTWQGLLMVITRKGQPLMQAVKGLWTTGLWGAVAIVGTTAALKAGDSYSCWVLVQGLRSTKPDLGGQCSAGDVVNAALSGEATARLKVMLLPTLLNPGMIIIMGLVVLIVVVLQAVLMVFRNGSLIILTGVVQLAAAGTTTRGTSSWLRKVLAWMLALVTYKPIAATVFGTSFLLLRTDGKDPRTLFMGMAMLALSVIALPALMKFFNWGVGAVGGDGAGMHAASASANAGMAAGNVPKPSGGGGSAGSQAQFVSSSMPAQAGSAAGAAPAAAGGATAFAPPAIGAAGGAAGGGAAAGGAAAGGAAAAGAGVAATGGVAAVAAPVLLGGAAAIAGAHAAKKAATSAMGTDEER
jgi:hypothetical protein